MKTQWIYIGCFAALAAALTAADMLGQDRYFSQTENRILQQRPQMKAEEVLNGSWENSYESYLTDQFVGRDAWIGLKTVSEKWMGKKDINGVYLAEDGYLIEKHDAASIDGEDVGRKLERLHADLSEYGQILARNHRVGAAQASTEEAARAHDAAQAGEAAYAGEVRVMLVPTADVILRDKLPRFAEDFDQLACLDKLDKVPVRQAETEAAAGEQTEGEAAGVQMEGEAAGVQTEPGAAAGARVRVEEALAAHSGEEIYYRTDHHWTTLGAYYGYAAWADSMGLSAVPPEQFEQRTVSDSFLGTLHSKINLPMKGERIVLFEPKQEASYRVRYDLREDSADSLYAMEHLETKNQYGVFLDDNHALVQIDTQDGQKEKRGSILLIKDSYANCFAPFLTAHYDTVYLIDKRYYHGSISAFLEENRVDDVLILYDVIHFLDNY